MPTLNDIECTEILWRLKSASNVTLPFMLLSVSQLIFSSTLTIYCSYSYIVLYYSI